MTTPHSPEDRSNARASVLLVSNAPFLGGAERSLQDLGEALAREGEHSVCLACPKGPGTTPGQSQQRLVHVLLPSARVERARGFCFPLALWRLLISALRVRAIARSHKADLIHANGIKAGLIVALGAWLAGVPWVLHLRDYYPRYPRLTRMMLRRARATIATSSFLAEATRQYTDLEGTALSVIPNGVDCCEETPCKIAAVRKGLGIPAPCLLVTMIAQLVPWKRHDLFLEAAALVARMHSDAHFLIVGSDQWGLNGSYETSLRERAQAPDLANRVTFLGQREDAGDILAASDISILPSDNEPFGRVVVESWWAGTPVVVSDTGGPAELVADGITGLHFKQEDAASLARALERLITDSSLRSRLAEAGREEAPKYSVSRHCQAVTGVYRRVLA